MVFLIQLDLGVGTSKLDYIYTQPMWQRHVQLEQLTVNPTPTVTLGSFAAIVKARLNDYHFQAVAN